MPAVREEGISSSGLLPCQLLPDSRFKLVCVMEGLLAAVSHRKLQLAQ